MEKKKYYYGGQAVVEGVMMRGQKTVATAVRRPNGRIAIDTRTLSGIYTGKWRKMPMVRGAIVLIESLVLGMKSLFYSANISMEEEEEEVSNGVLGAVMAGSLVFAVALFFLLPLFLTRLFNIANPIVFNLVDGAIRVLILVIYLRVMNFLPDIRRTFEYHGAEHTVVNAYEEGNPLNLDAVKAYGKAHVRCGTSFIFIVMVISILVFAVVGIQNTILMVLSRIVLIPVIAALSYEIISWGGRHPKNPVMRAILTPGLWLQSLTTRVPDDRQLGVALAALRSVVEREEPEEATWTTVIEGTEPELPETSAEPEENKEEALQPPPEDSVS